MKNIPEILDSVADSLEARGLIKEAYELDKVADGIAKTADVATQVENMMGINKIPNMNLRNAIKDHLNVLLPVITNTSLSSNLNMSNKITAYLKRADQMINAVISAGSSGNVANPVQ